MPYSKCSGCNRPWDEVKIASHKTSETKGLFLFCKGCDANVNLEDRHKALDEWKVMAIAGMCRFANGRKAREVLYEIGDILNTEFIEYPRSERIKKGF